MRDYVKIFYVFGFDINPMPPPDKVMIFAGCYPDENAVRAAPPGTAGIEVYPVWLRLNKFQIVNLNNGWIAQGAGGGPNTFYDILKLQLGDESGPFWTRSPRDDGINSVTEEK